MDDDNQPGYNTGPDPEDDDDQEYIIPDDYGPPPDDDLDMPEIQDSGETHQPSSPSTPFPILTFQSKRLLILDKMTILHQDLIQRLSQSEFRGNRDRSQLILLMLYQRQRPRLLSRGQGEGGVTLIQTKQERAAREQRNKYKPRTETSKKLLYFGLSPP